MKDPKQVTKGKKNRISGADFERRVRKDLEEKGWIVDKWSNNVEFNKDKISMGYGQKFADNIHNGKLIPSKHKFRGPGIPMAMGTGFPDFVCHRLIKCLATAMGELSYKVIGVEAKSNGYLKPEEKEKCKWLIENQIFSKILIAKKTKVKNRIVVEYKVFEVEE